MTSKSLDGVIDVDDVMFCFGLVNNVVLKSGDVCVSGALVKMRSKKDKTVDVKIKVSMPAAARLALRTNEKCNADVEGVSVSGIIKTTLFDAVSSTLKISLLREGVHDT